MDTAQRILQEFLLLPFNDVSQPSFAPGTQKFNETEACIMIRPAPVLRTCVNHYPGDACVVAAHHDLLTHGTFEVRANATRRLLPPELAQHLGYLKMQIFDGERIAEFPQLTLVKPKPAAASTEVKVAASQQDHVARAITAGARNGRVRPSRLDRAGLPPTMRADCRRRGYWLRTMLTGGHRRS